MIVFHQTTMNSNYININELNSRISSWEQNWPQRSHDGVARSGLPPRTGGIYIFSNNRHRNVVKIGVTVNFYSRLSDLTRSITLPRKDVIFHTITASDHFTWEQRISARLKFLGHYAYGEMFHLSPEQAYKEVLATMAIVNFPPPPYVNSDNCQNIRIFINSQPALHIPNPDRSFSFIYVLTDCTSQFTKIGNTSCPEKVYNYFKTSNLSGVGEIWFFKFTVLQSTTVVEWLANTNKDVKVNGLFIRSAHEIVQQIENFKAQFNL